MWRCGRAAASEAASTTPGRYPSAGVDGAPATGIRPVRTARHRLPRGDRRQGLRVLSASDRPPLDGLLCQKRREFESLLVPRAGRIWALEGEGFAGVKASADGEGSRLTSGLVRIARRPSDNWHHCLKRLKALARMIGETKSVGQL